MNIGVVGCGNISSIYLENGKKLRDLDIVACADLDVDKAKAQAEKYGVPKACTVDELNTGPRRYTERLSAMEGVSLFRTNLN